MSFAIEDARPKETPSERAEKKFPGQPYAFDTETQEVSRYVRQEYPKHIRTGRTVKQFSKDSQGMEERPEILIARNLTEERQIRARLDAEKQPDKPARGRGRRSQTSEE